MKSMYASTVTGPEPRTIPSPSLFVPAGSLAGMGALELRASIASSLPCKAYNRLAICLSMAAVFEVLAEPTRRRILDLLTEREHAVGELVERLGASQPGVSK